MFRALTLAGAMTLSLITAGAASASDKEGLYINIGGTMLSTEQDLSNTEIQGQIVDLGVQQADLTLINGRIGYRLNDYLAIEGEAGFGVGDDDFNRQVPVDVLGSVVNVDTNIGIEADDYYIAFARGIFPVSEQFDIFARIGYGQASGTADVTAMLAGFSGSASITEKADDVAYGVGAQFDFTANDGVRADYTRLDDTDILSIAYARRF